MTTLSIRLKGGPGSGHHNHRGRPGKVGGALPDSTSDAALLDQLANTANWDAVSHDYEKGISDSYKAHIVDDGFVIVKPGTSYVSGYDINDPYKEEDTYLLAEALGLDVVPPSATTKINGKTNASVQQWIDNAKIVGNFHIYKEDNRTLDEDSFEQIVWLDAIIGNTDRHSGNIIVADKGDGVYKAYAIDHGLAWFTDDWRKNKAQRTLYDPLDITDAWMNGISEKNRELHKFDKKYYSRAIKFLENTDGKLYKRFALMYGEEFMLQAAFRVNHLYDRITTQGRWK